MIALLKYGTGVPFKRLERLQEQLGMPLPATTQWELMGRRREADAAGAGGTDPAGGAGQRDAQRRHGNARFCDDARAGRQAHGHLHQRHRID